MSWTKHKQSEDKIKNVDKKLPLNTEENDVNIVVEKVERILVLFQEQVNGDNYSHKKYMKLRMTE
jgi:hypothetical protein